MRTFQVCVPTSSSGGLSYEYVEVKDDADENEIRKACGDVAVEKVMGLAERAAFAFPPRKPYFPASIKVKEYNKEKHRTLRGGLHFKLKRGHMTFSFRSGGKRKDVWYA